MTKYKQYNKFCEVHKNDEQEEFFFALAQEFDVSYATALDIWYAEQRSWFREEMIDELIRLDKVTNEFHPNLTSGEFEWDAVNKKFVFDLSV